MASPHVAGGAALMLQAHPKTNLQAMRRILQNSADPAPWSLNPSIGYYDSVHRQGAGMLDIDDAILATTRVEPGKISLGESEYGPVIHTLTISITVVVTPMKTIYAFPWDGTTYSGNKVRTVPDGDYYVVISVLKPLGDDNNPAHWETWTSPVFSIERP